jgi:predicted amidohydrolase
MGVLRVSATQFDVRPLQKPEDFWGRVEALVKQAASEDSGLILFPEYFTVPWLLALNGQDFEKALDGFDDVKGDFHSRFQEMAKQYQMIIVAGSVPLMMRVRRVNRCFTYLPDGRKFEQDKQNMTRFESEKWDISGGHPNIRFWEWRGAGLGAAISYDIEFPVYTKELTKKDVDVILVPACTGDAQGYWRVRHCSQARAVESQTYVIMSSLVGGNPHILGQNKVYGRGGIFTPCDVDFPEEGLAGLGTLNEEGVITHSLDIKLLHKVREEGTVLNRRDIF